MLEMTLTQVQVAMGDLPGAPGGKILQFVDMSTGGAIKVTVPLDEKSVKAVIAGLGSGLIIAPGPLRGPGDTGSFR